MINYNTTTKVSFLRDEVFGYFFPEKKYQA